MALAKDIAVIRVNEDGEARFAFGRIPRYVQGINRVVQVYLLALLTRSGSIITASQYGSGLYELAPASVVNESDLHTSVAAAVSKAREDVQKEQNKHELEAADRLSGVTILAAKFDANARQYFLTLEIRNEAGASIIVKL